MTLLGYALGGCQFNIYSMIHYLNMQLIMPFYSQVSTKKINVPTISAVQALRATSCFVHVNCFEYSNIINIYFIA